VVVALSLVTGTAYLRVYLDVTINTADDVSRVSNLPSLPAIPLINPKNEEHRVVSLEKPLDPAVDVFRALRTVVHFKVKTKSNPVNRITSSLPEDGKSIVAANLAVVFAQGGSSVLLTDADLRRPSQHRLFGLSSGRGFSTFLQNHKPNFTVKSLQEILENCIESTDQENLWIIQGGGSNGFDLSMLDLSLIEEVLWLAKNRFDHIIVDSAHLLVTSDSLPIGSKVDGVILLASAGRTRRIQLKQMATQLEMIETNVLGVTLN
jgi:succinoglycan biosynthesis transport protein ExoP